MTDGEEKKEPQSNKEEKEEYLPPFIEYLLTAQGHEIATRIINIFEDIKKATIDKSAKQAELNLELTHRYNRHLLIQQYVVFVVGIIAASALIYFEKFNSTAGVFFGTVLGYFFGRKSSPTP